MSTKQTVGESSQKKVHHKPESTDTLTTTTQPQSTTSTSIRSEQQSDVLSSTAATRSTLPATVSTQSSRKDPPISSLSPSAKPASHQTPETTSTPATSTPPDDQRLLHRPRQVIAVSANKGPTAFFNLARKFLVTDEICDLSALEGAIVSAADAAHLLERSQLATIIRVQTSYVNVEPKRRRQLPSPSQSGTASMDPSMVVSSSSSAVHPSREHYATSSDTAAAMAASTEHQHHEGGGNRVTSSGRELRRARIVITVKRTASYKQWLDDNPSQVITSVGDDDDVDVDDVDIDADDIGIVDDSRQDL